MAVQMKRGRPVAASAPSTGTESGKINLILRKGCQTYVLLGGKTYVGGTVYPVEQKEAGMLMSQVDEQGVPYFHPASAVVLRAAKEEARKKREEQELEEVHEEVGELDTAGVVKLEDSDGEPVGTKVAV